ncbi:MAG: N-acetylmuramoyl-L-alanine amidase [Verrucomicrobia bacterium]|nr:MAG: N-acetylmuramoyl-L-alanine amidase [Verrucomicrobiota bacterium]TAE86269.1 MAG: N-acetylmuramoyl-L-alanine amidase [Verrucomicrobiota bacterium]TAF23063.1 MAG: N-acetylmuramoyl-L-alanine amidase [Verrucomicrobiota bacterium]TAF39954.1 MAG: N-acetylmuramoyl-L-alanine amidase [Verrucomicrobiota bacterium]
MKWPFVVPLLVLGLLCFHCTRVAPLGGRGDEVVGLWGAAPLQRGGRSVWAPVSAAGLQSEIHLRVDMVARGTHGRKVLRPMTPRYITIHSTQNYAADASRHALALKRGALRSTKRRGGNRIGYMIWHYTVDDRVAIQHMPVTEQGEHADFDGPGNRLSIGIEMCEHRGNNRAATIERTAKLVAKLMHDRGIPLSRVVPHYHWPRRGKKPPNKNCPHFLLDHGRPGPKWRWFLGRVDYHYRRAYQHAVAAR